MSAKKKSPSPAEDEELNAEEIADAAEETPTDTTAPELSAQTKELTEWDDVPASHGTAGPKVTEDEEDSIAAKLVYEGTDEADRDTRLADADPDFQP